MAAVLEWTQSGAGGGELMETTLVALPYWSASRLKMLLQCPRQFRYCYVEAIPAIATAPLVFGKAIHEVLRNAGEEQMATSELPAVPEMVRQFALSWRVALEENRPYFAPNQPTRDDYLLLGGDILERFYHRQAHRPPPLAVELAFEIPFGDQTLVGFVDRVDEGQNGLIVVDYKSGKRKPSPNEAAKDLQLTVYALAVREMLGQRIDRVEFHFLRDGCGISSTRDAIAIQTQLGEVWKYAQSTIASGEFLPSPGYYCRFCDYRELCEAEGFEISGGEPNGLRR